MPHLVDEDLGTYGIGSSRASRSTPIASRLRTRPQGALPRRRGLDEAALRYARAFERLLARDEAATLVVCHEIPVRYLVNAAAPSSELNGPHRFGYVENATPYLFDEASLERAGSRTAFESSPGSVAS